MESWTEGILKKEGRKKRVRKRREEKGMDGGEERRKEGRKKRGGRDREREGRRKEEREGGREQVQSTVYNLSWVHCFLGEQRSRFCLIFF